MIPDITNLKLNELDDLCANIEERIVALKYQEWKSTIHTKEEILEMFTRRGYVVPNGSKIWKVRPRFSNADYGYGMQVGTYEHSCHIDTTDFIVLLVVTDHDSYVDSQTELWLSDLITI